MLHLSVDFHCSDIWRSALEVEVVVWHSSSSTGQHLSYEHCLERKDNQNCCMLCGVGQLCTMINAEVMLCGVGQLCKRRSMNSSEVGGVARVRFRLVSVYVA